MSNIYSSYPGFYGSGIYGSVPGISAGPAIPIGPPFFGVPMTIPHPVEPEYETIVKTIQVPKTVMEEVEIETQVPKMEMEQRTIQVPTTVYDDTEIDVPVTRQVTEPTTKYVPRTVLVPVTVNVTKTITETETRTIQVPRTAYEEKVIEVPRPVYETRTISVQRPKVEMVEEVITEQVPRTTMVVKQIPQINYPIIGAPTFPQFQPSFAPFPGAFPRC
jgi:hypothetical protein